MDERLEIIKDKQLQMHALSTFDINWLIQQAEKVQELEKQWSFSQKFYDKKYQRLAEENQRYKEALEFYANPQIWKEGKLITDNRYEMPLAYNDNGEKAQQALEGES
ncbi:hypothetical protein [Oceanobacillus sp. FSL K6-0251]|uniref:hypothetical protein n=1 Tax=Oceanobacillus sp. FSL K6-0251 TaxID=2921602 RepID=UPI0030F8B3A8